jgi:hypothetical protein
VAVVLRHASVVGVAGGFQLKEWLFMTESSLAADQEADRYPRSFTQGWRLLGSTASLLEPPCKRL